MALLQTMVEAGAAGDAAGDWLPAARRQSFFGNQQGLPVLPATEDTGDEDAAAAAMLLVLAATWAPVLPADPDPSPAAADGETDAIATSAAGLSAEEQASLPANVLSPDDGLIEAAVEAMAPAIDDVPVPEAAVEAVPPAIADVPMPDAAVDAPRPERAAPSTARPLASNSGVSHSANALFQALRDKVLMEPMDAPRAEDAGSLPETSRSAGTPVRPAQFEASPSVAFDTALYPAAMESLLRAATDTHFAPSTAAVETPIVPDVATVPTSGDRREPEGQSPEPRHGGDLTGLLSAMRGAQAVQAFAAIQFEVVDQLAPADAPRTPTLPNEAAVAARLVQSMRVQYRSGVGTAVVNLDPGYLGAVTIALQVERGLVTATLHAANAEVRTWMQANEAALRQGLADQGLSLERLVVSEEERSQEQGARHPGERQSQERRNHHPRRSPQRDQATTFDVVV